jgi:hypothetical protein
MAVLTVGQSIVPKGKTLISTTEISSGVSAINISNIPQIYTDLSFVWRNVTQSSDNTLYVSLVRFNSDSSASYKSHAASIGTSNILEGNTAGTSWGAIGRREPSTFVGGLSQIGQWGMMTIYNYSSSLFKSIESKNQLRFGENSFTTGSYMGGAITSINIVPASAFTYSSGTLLLYGVV